MIYIAAPIMFAAAIAVIVGLVCLACKIEEWIDAQ